MKLDRRLFLTLGILLLLFSCEPKYEKSQGLPDDYIIYNANILTMNRLNPNAEAVYVSKGKIKAVGTFPEVTEAAPNETYTHDLKGATMLPGFVDPHLHVQLAVIAKLMTDLSPCLPEPYETRSSCQKTIQGALQLLKKSPKPANKHFLIANQLDPSRAHFSDEGTITSKDFQKNPADFIEKYVAKDTAVFILDQSGHLAYANRQAFVEAGICKSQTDCNINTADKIVKAPGQWVTDTLGNFTGLLRETPSYKVFTDAAIKKGVLPNIGQEIFKFPEIINDVVRGYAKAGLTTVVNGGALSTGEIEFIKFLATFHKNKPLLRYRTIVDWKIAKEHPGVKTKVWEEKNGGLYGCSGIKLWGDGSTQGCTAGLCEKYDQDTTSFCYNADNNGFGYFDYNREQIRDSLRSFWLDDWYLQMHTNGDSTMKNAMWALERLYIEYQNPNPHLLIHATVGGNTKTGEDLTIRMKELRDQGIDLQTSHLIAHVAYWGGTFMNELDGYTSKSQSESAIDNGTYLGRASMLDPTGSEIKRGIPFSLHSDNTVSPAKPLYYVQQAVTRDTWWYPNLKNEDVARMPNPEQKVTVQQALEAVTIIPANQHMLGEHIGSIEVSKAADFVVLEKNPLETPLREISAIKVLATYVNGYQHNWTN